MEALFGKTLKELEEITSKLSLPRFTAKQIAQWLYKHRAESIDAMTNLSKAARNSLAQDYEIGLQPPSSVAVSKDGTKKYLFGPEGRRVETAWIPEDGRGTLCVSSQVGCQRGCRFCMTARQGFQANLTAREVLNQFHSLPESNEVTNFVFMGMGEPLDNLDALLPALEILCADWGYGFSPKRVTVSTIGVIEGLEQVLQQSECRLALSLHSPFPEERSQLIPAERRYPMNQVLQFFKQEQLGKRRLTVEYLMLDQWNDSPKHSAQLARILEGTGARINLIPYHPIPDFPGKSSPASRIEAFQADLKRRGIMATVRRSRGLDISAACGMLSTKDRLQNSTEETTPKGSI
ncbi:MAG: 23S rRNA (adenine(2503)-C(2))-methyltransferase RlmN [Spirochaetales bacterium]|nr:23S rRNA (adenine(2503)-C(2))-methyltransferase RlmN [Spirochaetales bacterium]